MIIHISLFNWKPEIQHEEINQLMKDIASLKEHIPEIIDTQERTSQSGLRYTHAVVATFESKEALDRYRNLPLHIPIAKRVDEMELDSIGIDFEG